ncbi:MAG: hypothetical protein HY908_13575 [Myxococcales bacterium]|nr:hypothetical protein [Myxococcales bacterium]
MRPGYTLLQAERQATAGTLRGARRTWSRASLSLSSAGPASKCAATQGRGWGLGARAIDDFPRKGEASSQPGESRAIDPVA